MRFLTWLNRKIHCVSHSRISSNGLYANGNIVSAAFHEESVFAVSHVKGILRHSENDSLLTVNILYRALQFSGPCCQKVRICEHVISSHP